MPEKKYISHSSENCFGKRYNQQSIKYGLGGSLGNRADAVNQYKNPEHKWKKELKSLKKKNKMLYNIAKKWLLLPPHHLCGFLDCYGVIESFWCFKGRFTYYLNHLAPLFAGP